MISPDNEEYDETNNYDANSTEATDDGTNNGI